MAKLKEAHSVEVEKRVKIIADEVLKGLTRGRIVEKYGEKWGLSESSFDNIYLKRAYKYIRDNVKEDLANIKETQVNRLLEIYNDAYSTGDKSSMFKSLDMINRLAGCYDDKQKIELKLTDYVFGFADEEIEDEE